MHHQMEANGSAERKRAWKTWKTMCQLPNFFICSVSARQPTSFISKCLAVNSFDYLYVQLSVEKFNFFCNSFTQHGIQMEKNALLENVIWSPFYIGISIEISTEPTRKMRFSPHPILCIAHFNLIIKHSIDLVEAKRTCRKK